MALTRHETGVRCPAAARRPLLASSPSRYCREKTPEGGIRMPITLAHVQPLVALVAGILILIMPRLLNFIVAIYLIFIGLVGLWPRLQHLLH
jgi:hypothetical protein